MCVDPTEPASGSAASGPRLHLRSEVDTHTHRRVDHRAGVPDRGGTSTVNIGATVTAQRWSRRLGGTLRSPATGGTRHQDRRRRHASDRRRYGDHVRSDSARRRPVSTSASEATARSWSPLASRCSTGPGTRWRSRRRSGSVSRDGRHHRHLPGAREREARQRRPRLPVARSFEPVRRRHVGRHQRPRGDDGDRCCGQCGTGEHRGVQWVEAGDQPGDGARGCRGARAGDAVHRSRRQHARRRTTRGRRRCRDARTRRRHRTAWRGPPRRRRTLLQRLLPEDPGAPRPLHDHLDRRARTRRGRRPRRGRRGHQHPAEFRARLALRREHARCLDIPADIDRDLREPGRCNRCGTDRRRDRRARRNARDRSRRARPGSGRRRRGARCGDRQRLLRRGGHRRTARCRPRS